MSSNLVGWQQCALACARTHNSFKVECFLTLYVTTQSCFNLTLWCQIQSIMKVATHTHNLALSLFSHRDLVNFLTFIMTYCMNCSIILPQLFLFSIYFFSWVFKLQLKPHILWSLTPFLCKCVTMVMGGFVLSAAPTSNGCIHNICCSANWN